MAKKPPANVAPANARAGQGQPKPPTAPRRTGIKVMATKTCYYDDKRRREGDVFTIANEGEFSPNYMEKVDPDTPEKITTGKEVLKQHHDDIVSGKVTKPMITPDDDAGGPFDDHD